MKPKVTSLAPGDYSHKQSEQLRLREFVWVEITSPPPLPAALASGPSTRASRGPWGCRCRGTRGPARSRPWPCRSPPRRGRLGPRARPGPGCPPAFAPPCATAPRTQASGSGCARRVGGIGAEHRAQPLLGRVAAPQRRPCPREPASAVATRVASGGTSAPTAMVCRQRPSVAHLSLSRENRLCASDAAAGLAFSPRCQPTKPPKSSL